MKILLAIDGSEYTKRMLAYLAAHDEMLGKDNTYTALTVIAPMPAFAASYLDPGIVERAYHEQADETFAPVIKFAAQQGWELSTRYDVGHAGDVIAEQARAGGYDLLVMGSHGHSTVGSVLLGSVAVRVLSQCKTPVLLIR